MLSDVFEVGVSHVFHTENENVRILVNGGVDGAEEGFTAFSGGFLLDDRGVDDAVALGFRHCCGVCGVVGIVLVLERALCSKLERAFLEISGHGLEFLIDNHTKTPSVSISSS